MRIKNVHLPNLVTAHGMPFFLVWRNCYVRLEPKLVFWRTARALKALDSDFPPRYGNSRPVTDLRIFKDYEKFQSSLAGRLGWRCST